MACAEFVIRDPELEAIANLIRLATGCPCGKHPVTDDIAWHRVATAIRASKLAVRKQGRGDLPEALPAHFRHAYLSGKQLGAVTDAGDIDPGWILLCVLDAPTKDGAQYSSFYEEKWPTPLGLSSAYDMFWIPRMFTGAMDAIAFVGGARPLAATTDPALAVSQRIEPFLVRGERHE